MSSDPYAPPAVAPKLANDKLEQCPACGAEMETGWVKGRLNWLPVDASPFQRLIGGKLIIGARSLTLALSNRKQAAFQCHQCGILVVLPKS